MLVLANKSYCCWQCRVAVIEPIWLFQHTNNYIIPSGFKVTNKYVHF